MTAEALSPNEREQDHHEVQIKVLASMRETIDLPESSEFDATFMSGVSDAGALQDLQKTDETTLYVFGGKDANRCKLDGTTGAIKWLNDNLFTTEAHLVRQNESTSGPMLNDKDQIVLKLLRDMARHGSAIYNQLKFSIAKDPGERIQILNLEPNWYVPLEYVYDQGYPDENAVLCDRWQQALQSDEQKCPECNQLELTPKLKRGNPVICPLGFWSLQKIIERRDPEIAESNNSSVPSSTRRKLPTLNTTLFAISHHVTASDRKTIWQTLQQCFQNPIQADDWDEWLEALEDKLEDKRPTLLLMLPHHGVDAGLDYLEIGAQNLLPQKGRLSRGQLDENFVNPKGIEPGPIVLLLGCQTAAQTEVGYVNLARSFQQLQASIVLGTMAKILGRHATPVASELVRQLLSVNDPQADFGTIMRRVRRRMLAKGYLMALCLVALGDAEWKISPRIQTRNNP